jgi:alpha-ribazole phosphatase
MTRVILIRHGQTEWNISGRFQGQTDISLTALGIEQAKKAAEYLKNEPLAAVYASDLTRAMETGRQIAAKHNLEVKPLAELREINFGKWEGMSYDEIKEKWQGEIDKLFGRVSELNIPEGENFRAVIDRAVPAIAKLIKKHDGQTIALISHGAVLRAVLGHYLNMPLDNIWSIRQDNTAINRLMFCDDGRAIIELLNSTAHLELGEIKK